MKPEMTYKEFEESVLSKYPTEEYLRTHPIFRLPNQVSKEYVNNLLDTMTTGSSDFPKSQIENQVRETIDSTAEVLITNLNDMKNELEEISKAKTGPVGQTGPIGLQGEKGDKGDTPDIRCLTAWMKAGILVAFLAAALNTFITYVTYVKHL